jgi:peptide chain release factor 2
MSEPDFWNNQELAQSAVQEVKALKGWIEPYDKLDGRIESTKELDDLLRDTPDAELEKELDSEI